MEKKTLISKFLFWCFYRRESESSQGRHPAEDISLRISPTWVIFYVILMCAMLVLLYFFMDYLGKDSILSYYPLIIQLCKSCRLLQIQIFDKKNFLVSS